MRARRRTHCPAGRLLYRHGEVPEGLATRTMLGQRRRRLAEGQRPVASYWTGYQYVPLYEVATSVALPALTPRRQARWSAARTCVRCAATAETPWPACDSRRLCPDCHTREQLAGVRPSHLALRGSAVTWARQVLADPSAVVLAAYAAGFGQPVEVAAVAAGDGRVLVDLVAWPTRPWPRCRWSRPPHAVDAASVHPWLAPLAGRRLIHAVAGPWAGPWADWVTPLLVVAEAAAHTRYHDLALPGVVDEHQGDNYGLRRRDWWAHPHPTPYQGRAGLADPPRLGGTAPAVAARIRTGLTRIARDDHPDGPPTCPVLPPAGTTACGHPAGPHGTCHDHPAEAGELR